MPTGADMTRSLTWTKGALLAAISVLSVAIYASAAATTQSPGYGAADAPAFLRANRCYRFTFPIAGAPNWKVLDVLDAGWIRAEVDAGPASSVREPAWINTAQIITAREARCSE
jgi:hypothetical protein